MARLSRRSWFGQVLGGLAASAVGPELLVVADTYSYRVTYVTAAGELPEPVPAIARKIYRANARGGPYRLVATITDTRTHYLDGEASP